MDKSHKFNYEAQKVCINHKKVVPLQPKKKQ